MNIADHILAGFHPLASNLLFDKLRSFETATAGIDRKADEQDYQLLCGHSMQLLRQDLEAAAQDLLRKHQDSPQIGAIDLQLRQVIQIYLYQFVQRSA